MTMNNQTIVPPKQTAVSRRSLLKSAAGGLAGGISLAGMIGTPVEDQVAYGAEGVQRSSSPSQLRINDLRIAVLSGAPFRCPLIRIDTNQGISGYGEVRDGADERYALMLKPRILNMNPCNVEMLFKRIKQFGHHARQGGGVSGVEMACWDLAGKAYGVPVYQMLGGRYRERIRLYADTPGSGPEALRRRLQQGFTFMKYDCGIEQFRRVEGALTYPANADFNAEHPFTAIELTDKGAALMAERFAQVREVIGMQMPLASDHFGHISVSSCIKLGKAVQPYSLAWLEDMVPWYYTDMLKEIKAAIDVPLLTGEDIYLLEDGFKPLIDARAVDMVQPDLATAGGILETKKIGDYAEQAGIAMAMHAAGSPVTFFANIHCAAATQNFIALEHHSVDIPWWDDLVTGVEKPTNNKGYTRVPEGPGLGFELNEEVVKQHLERGQEYFGPTEQWNRSPSNDRLWS
jgi:L-alanine-DL-glutamate epimerase-like enolase superfamily enzyme